MVNGGLGRGMSNAERRTEGPEHMRSLDNFLLRVYDELVCMFGGSY